MVQIMNLGIFPDHLFLSQVCKQAAQSNCIFLEHIIPACVDGELNFGFICTDGFTASLDTNAPACMNLPPSVLCFFPCKENGPSPSANAGSYLKRRRVGSGSRSEKGPCMAVVSVHGNVSTLLVISKVVRAYRTHLSHSACLFL